MNLFKLSTIRSQAMKAFQNILLEESNFFSLDLGNLDNCADYVIETIKKNYESLEKVPNHSRWRHLEIGSNNLWDDFFVDKVNSSTDNLMRKIDYLFVSILCDAGAGDKWTYFDQTTRKSFSRSEAIAIASFRAFSEGVFSSNKEKPWQADSDALKNITLDSLKKVFQIHNDNPMEGLKERVALLNKLGEALEVSKLFLHNHSYRPSHFLEEFMVRKMEEIPVDILFTLILKTLLPIWPFQKDAEGQFIGDTGYLNSVEGGYLPFHKLTQWLIYSLQEPLEDFGMIISNFHHLTGLPEYRNGGLLIDMDVIKLKDSTNLVVKYGPHDNLVTEWRALTICLLDELHKLICEKENLSQNQFTLSQLLQGGSWSAGRKIAKEKRKSGDSPILLAHTGTFF